ncbi:MAG: ribbon-helix-helix domain-containing protein [Actinobacteria bacterium]|nr:ribbon-helix-helix domain-containing protein [Actinomycetota bacterium]
MARRSSRTQTLVQLSDTLLAMLDQRAARRGVSRSQLIREAVEAHLADDLEAEISRRILAGYEAVPQSTLDEWGDPSGVAAATARDLHRRLDAEEAEAGQPGW